MHGQQLKLNEETYASAELSRASSYQILSTPRVIRLCVRVQAFGRADLHH